MASRPSKQPAPTPSPTPQPKFPPATQPSAPITPVIPQPHLQAHFRGGETAPDRAVAPQQSHLTAVVRKNAGSGEGKIPAPDPPRSG
jgi:hypothetical protein